MTKKVKLYIILTCAFSVLAIILGTAIGSVFIPLRDVVIVLLEKLHINFLTTDSEIANPIIWKIRLPRVLLAFIVGAALSVSGCIMQSILKNPLASSTTMGVASGSTLGIAIVIVTGFTLPFLPGLTYPIVSFVFGFITAFGCIFLATKLDKSMSNNSIILLGMVFAMFVGAFLMLIQSLFPDSAEQILAWSMGSFALKGWEAVVITLIISVVGIVLSIHYSKELDILSFGEEQAQTIGVDSKKVKFRLLVISTVLTGGAVAFAGVIGFIDLIAPHVVRKIFGPKHKLLIPMSALFGGIFMVAADLVARTIISPHELSVGVVSALVGAPFFTVIFFKRKKV